MNKTYYILLLVFFVFITGEVFGGQSQLDLNVNACKKVEKADDELNKLYKKITQKYKKDKKFLNHLKNAQELWGKFVEAHINSIYPPEGAWGSVEPMCRCIERRAFVEQRKQDLETWLNAQEGNVCNGTRNFNLNQIK